MTEFGDLTSHESMGDSYNFTGCQDSILSASQIGSHVHTSAPTVIITCKEVNMRQWVGRGIAALSKEGVALGTGILAADTEGVNLGEAPGEGV